MTAANPVAFGSLTTAAGFETAARRLMPALRGYALRLTRDRSQSEDLVQETLLRAWAARDRFIPNSNLKAWLFKIEYNCFLTVLRKTRRVVQLDPDRVALEPSMPAMQDEGLLQKELVIAIAALPKAQAAALHLINDQQISYEEAAQRLGVAVGTVKSRAARARAALCRTLEGETGQGVRVRQSGAVPDLYAIDGAITPYPMSVYQRWKASGQRLIG